MLDRPFSPDTRIVSRKEKPPVLERGCDICVIGSGASGISAAVEAARAGRSVILVDGLPSLGGQAVNSIIGMFCGLYTPGKDGRQVTHGIADEILHDLGVTNDVKVVAGGVMKVAMYNEVALGRWVEKAVLKAGVTPLTGAIIRSVNKDGRRITSLDVATRHGDVRITATGFIDATGDAAVTWEGGAARRAGARIVAMVEEGLCPRKVLTESAFRNATAMVLAVSGSINAIKHLQATAIEAENGVDVYALWEEMGRKVPILSAVRPNGAVRIEQFEDAGGAAAILKRLAPVIDTTAMTSMGKTLSAILASMPEGDIEIIRPLSNPISQGPSIAILRGSLAPESAVVKLGIRDGSRPESFDGRAVVYDDTPAAMRDIKAGKLQKGDVVVLRGQGIKGGPAMGGGASLILFAIDAAGLAKDVAFVTDGQLSGLCLKGLTVAEVSPEGATGGPIGKVRSGDRIVIDVPAAELAARSAPSDVFPIPAKGYLGIYRRDVQPMATGAVLTDLK
jgi:ribulose 1,5-bisphosphate synthetase/thiazole synthase